MELKKPIKLIKQNPFEKEEQEKHNTGVTNYGKKHVIKEEPKQKMERFGVRQKTRPTGNRPSRICGVSKWTPLHKCPAKETNRNKRGKRGHYAKVCRQKKPSNQTVKRLTEEEPDARSGTSSESNQPHKRNKEISKEKQTLHGNSTDEREKEKIYNRYRITNNNKATGRRNS